MRFLLTVLTIIFVSGSAFAEETNRVEDWRVPKAYSGDDIVAREERLSLLYEELDQNPDSQRREELYTLIAGAYRDLLTFLYEPESYSMDDEFAREERSARIYGELEQYPAPEREAELLYEEAMLMLETPEEMYSLKLATTNLLYAIELNPDCMEYKKILCEVYEDYWKDRELTGDDEVSKSRRAVKDKAEIMVKAYRDRTNP